MAVRLLESFDWAYSTASIADRGWSNDDATNITLQSSGGPSSGKKFIRFGGGMGSSSTVDFQGIGKTLHSRIVGNTIRMAFWIRITSGYSYPASLVAGEGLIKLDMYVTATGDAPNISVGMHSGGFLDVFRMETSSANGRTLVVTGTTDLRTGAWRHVELEIVVDPTAGSVKSWIDGVADINTTGVDTQDATGFDLTYMARAKFGTGVRDPASGFDVDIADLVIWDDDTSDVTNKFSGALPSHIHRISCVLPSSDDSVQFTRSTGAVNAQNVDDAFTAASDGDTTYNSSSTSGHLDHFNFSFPVYADDVYSVQEVIECKIDSSSNTRARVRGSAKNVSTLNSEDRFASIPSYKPVEFIFAKDPNTGADWTNTTLGNTKFGYGR